MTKHKKYHLGIKGLIKNEKGKILLLKKSPDRSEKYGRKAAWDIPGGRIEEGLSIEETLKQEIREETGIQNFENKGLFYAVVSNYWFEDLGCGLILFIYDVVPVSGYKVELDDEHTEFGWFGRDKACKLLGEKYPKDFIEKLKNEN